MRPAHQLTIDQHYLDELMGVFSSFFSSAAKTVMLSSATARAIDNFMLTSDINT
jgi:hypothetical protein